jgi:hypothetical protein
MPENSGQKQVFAKQAGLNVSQPFTACLWAHQGSTMVLFAEAIATT